MNTLTLHPLPGSATLKAPVVDVDIGSSEGLGSAESRSAGMPARARAHYGPVSSESFLSHAFQASDAGVGRTHNEDAILCRPDLGLFCVADGMGGFNAGEVASGLVLATIERRLSSVSTEMDRASLESLLMSAISEANAAVLRTSARRPECLGMGTTLALLWLTPLGIIHAHIGDSRLYSFQNGQLRRLSRDHVIEELPEVLRGRFGDENAARKGILTRAIGAEALVEADYQWLKPEAGMDFLLCSDGLSDALTDLDIQDNLSSPGANLAQVLVEHALDQGAADNVSALVVSLSKVLG